MQKWLARPSWATIAALPPCAQQPATTAQKGRPRGGGGPGIARTDQRELEKKPGQPSDVAAFFCKPQNGLASLHQRGGGGSVQATAWELLSFYTPLFHVWIFAAGELFPLIALHAGTAKKARNHTIIALRTCPLGPPTFYVQVLNARVPAPCHKAWGGTVDGGKNAGVVDG